MQAHPATCEWFRGCSNPAVVHYAFSDKWFCGYCIGYARIEVPLCADDSWRRGTCVDPESQTWFCDSHATRCDAIVERPPGHFAGNSRRCVLVGALYSGNHNNRYYCIEHMPEDPEAQGTEQAIAAQRLPPPSTSPPPTLQSPLRTSHSSNTSPRITISPPTPRSSYPPQSVAASRREGRRTIQTQDRSITHTLPPRSTVPRPVSQRPQYNSHVPTQPRSLVARIANAISSLSSVLLSPESDLPPYLAGAVSAVQDTPAVAGAIPHSATQIDLDIFSTVVDTECCICLEPQRSMRRLIACNHMFCEDCLSKQVNGPYARAHDCPLCRKDMFDLRGTDWETY